MNKASSTITALGLLAMLAPATALADDHAEYLNSGAVLPTTLPFSELVIVDDTLYLSGQIGNVPGTLDLAEGGIEGETRQVMENIRTSLQAHGYNMGNLVKCTVMLADIGEWGTFNPIYAEFFEDGVFPARAAFGASGLALGARVEVDCIGAR